jgi:hypothetical protein
MDCKVKTGPDLGRENEIILNFITKRNINDFFSLTVYGIISLQFAFDDFVACQFLSNLDAYGAILRKRASLTIRTKLALKPRQKY